ncbi:MAG TPA: RNA polymerase subunit sigma-70 [Solirubrobacteraceae bacterium]|nr:RNA polymerase subunit sigma-70 [Solirubrobacteraceae bacterium]
MAIDDQATFEALAVRHRRELQLHCYRMLGSLEESEDLVQETFLRAWRRRETFEGRSTARAWLYRIATNACLDAIAKRPRKPQGGEILWLQPYPDELLEGIEEPGAEPDAAVVERETIELAFMVAIQHLAPRPRAALILRDVLGWSAAETAALLETSAAAVNSALQRARAGLKEHLPERRLEWSADATAAERALVERYIDANDRQDIPAMLALMREDASFSMPPVPGVWTGRDDIAAMWREGGVGTPAFGDMRSLSAQVNRQPAVACYVRDVGADHYRPLALDVLRIEDGAIAEIVVFDGRLFASLGLPTRL